MLDEVFWEKLEACYQPKDGGVASYSEESPVLKQALESIDSDVAAVYELVEPIDRGGASVVVRVRHKKTGVDYALKLPRPCGDDILDSVKQEMQHLVKIRHENIIAIHDLGEVPVNGKPYPYFVMDYVRDAVDLRKRLEQLLRLTSSGKEVGKITQWVAQSTHSIARALAFLHAQSIVHFDVKPSNAFIDCAFNDRPILADLGYAKACTESDDELVVGFTLFYAHPDLAEHYLSGSSQNRIRKRMSPKNFRYEWDIYALGKSILELLALIDNAFPDAVGYDGTFCYLHLAACRMLDGRNLTDDQVDGLRKQQQRDEPISYWETWQKLGQREFQEEGIRYTAVSQIVRDLARLSINAGVPSDVPELDAFFPHTVQISELGPAPFTTRVKLIVEHPVFSRLADVPQVGLVRYVYPSATHTRLEHSIGVFRNCCHYVRALCNDPYNPLFKQLAGSDDIRCLLVASLLHDLGHYPFAHEMEEISPGFDHTGLTIAFLDNPTVDSEGHTIRDIIENPEWGWGIRLDSVRDLLTKESGSRLLPVRSLKTRLLASVLDGPVDTDKLDYLIRDSYECRLPYGKLIDYDRLVRNLTTVARFDDRGSCDLELGVYEKGQSAAESLTFARYLLYQAVYWHHSARAIRVMLRAALAPALVKRVEGKRAVRAKSFQDDFLALLGVSSEAQRVGTNDFLSLVERWTDDTGKELIALLKRRKFFKRVCTIHDERPWEEGRDSTWVKLQRVFSNRQFQEALHKAIVTEFASVVSSGTRSEASLLAPERANRVFEILQRSGSILVDMSSPSHGSEKSLRIVPEPQRLQRNYISRLKTSDRISEVWQQVHHRLMRIAAKGRVFCHPDVRDTLMAALSPEDIRQTLERVMDEFAKGSHR